jgi:hypothetical protein
VSGPWLDDTKKVCLLFFKSCPTRIYHVLEVPGPSRGRVLIKDDQAWIHMSADHDVLRMIGRVRSQVFNGQ